MKRRLLLGTLTALLALTATAGPAQGHGEDPRVRVRLDSVAGTPEAVTVQVRTTVSEQMLVANTSPRPLEVLDPAGEPFLRVDRSGVHADVRNPFFHRTLGPPDAPVSPPPTARGDAPPQWQLVTTESSWGWFDPRLHPEAATRGPGVLARWTVPLRYAGKPATARGALVREPMLGSWVPGRVEAPRGLGAALLSGARPAVALTRKGAAEVTVLDADGEVIARLDEHGVRVDPLSDAALSTTGSTLAENASDRLVTVSPGRFHAWLDERVQPSRRSPAHPTRTSAQGWRIPVLVDGQAAVVRGEWRWQPAAGARPDPAVMAARSASTWTTPAAVAGAGLAVAFGVRVLGRRLLRSRRQDA